jgi:hypothetical protein
LFFKINDIFFKFLNYVLIIIKIIRFLILTILIIIKITIFIIQIIISLDMVVQPDPRTLGPAA